MLAHTNRLAMSHELLASGRFITDDARLLSAAQKPPVILKDDR